MKKIKLPSIYEDKDIYDALKELVDAHNERVDQASTQPPTGYEDRSNHDLIEIYSDAYRVVQNGSYNEINAGEWYAKRSNTRKEIMRRMERGTNAS